MGRLKTPPKRLAALPSRLAPPTLPGSGGNDPQGRNARRSKSWVNTYRWQKLRQKIIKRDGAMCQQTGALLIAKHPDPNSPVVDHIIPHRGDETLFWDEDNLQTVAKHWHDREKQRQEKLGLV